MEISHDGMENERPVQIIQHVIIIIDNSSKYYMSREQRYVRAGRGAPPPLRASRWMMLSPVDLALHPCEAKDHPQTPSLPPFFLNLQDRGLPFAHHGAVGMRFLRQGCTGGGSRPARRHAGASSAGRRQMRDGGGDGSLLRGERSRLTCLWRKAYAPERGPVGPCWPRIHLPHLRQISVLQRRRRQGRLPRRRCSSGRWSPV